MNFSSDTTCKQTVSPKPMIHGSATCYKCGPFGSSFLSQTFGYHQHCGFGSEWWSCCV